MFKKVGTPTDTLSVNADGQTKHYCPACSKMTPSEMPKQAFVVGETASAKCRCGAVLP